MKQFLTSYFMIVSLLALCQQAQVELVISPKNVAAGETFAIMVTSTVHGTLEVDNLPTSFVQDYGISQGSHEEIDYNTGAVKTLYFFTYTGTISKTGEYTIGPAYVKNQNKVYASNKVKINVGKHVGMGSGNISSQQMKDPAFGVIEVNKKEIYEGEPLLVAAKIYSNYYPSDIGNYQPYTVAGTLQKHPVGVVKNIKVNEETVKGKKLYSLSYDKNIVFPDGVGKLDIEPFKLNLHEGYKSFPITSGSLTINIKPLPANAPKDFFGGVGHFELFTSIDTAKVNQGDVIKFTIEFSGTGNLHNLESPKIILPKGFIVYGDPVTVENFTFGMHGAEGSVSFEYNIQATKSGKQKINPFNFSYFDPDKEKYITMSSKAVQVDVKPNKNFTPAVDPESDPITEELPTRELEVRKEPQPSASHSFFGTIGYWTGLTFPVAAAFIFLFFTANKEKQTLRHEKRATAARNRALLDLQIAQAKIMIPKGDGEYYSSVQKIVNTLFLIQLGKENDVLSKSEILACLSQRPPRATLLVNQIWQSCEESRYSFGTGADKTELMQQVEELRVLIEG